MIDILFAKKEAQRSQAKKLGISVANILTRLILCLARSRRNFEASINNVRIYDAKTGRYRKRDIKPSLPDIIIITKGRFYGVEVKAI